MATAKPLRRLTVALACLVLLATAGTAYLASAAQGPVSREFDGIWQSRGYGWLWQIKDGRIVRYDIGKTFCIESRTSGPEWVDAESKPQLSEDHRTLRLLREDPDYFYTFERVAELPASCRQPPGTGPATVFDAVAENFAEHYAFFKERGIDWKRIEAEARARMKAVTDDAELAAVLEDLLSAIADSHVGIEATIDGEEESISSASERTYAKASGPPIISGGWSPRAAEALLGTSAQRDADELLRYGRFSTGIGYLEIRSMDGISATELEKALDRAMKALAGAKAVIVDVSRNDGGLDSFARRIARRFAAEPTVAYSKYAGDYDGDQPQQIVLQPPEGPRYLGPVYLITSHDTVSAAEIFTMAMRALPNVVHVGETTDGALSDELWKTLPNGWILSLSNEVYLDSDGKLWEGRGIPPEIPLAMSDEDDVTDEDRQSVRDVLAFIESN